MKEMRIGFLLGAGVSRPAGMPSTCQLTKTVLSVENYHEWSDGRFHKGGPEGLPGHLQPSRLWTSLLQKIEDYCKAYFDENHKSRCVNYEDLFFAASQLEEHLLGEYENPALEPLAKALLNDLPGVETRAQLRDSATRVCDYIRDVVAGELRGEQTKLEHLECLVDAMSDQTLKGCDVFTLNHDLLIETVLESHKIPFADGFGERDGDVSWWDSNVLDKGQRHYVLKLHGSTDWFDYPEQGLAKSLTAEGETARNGNGELLSVPERSRMLIGTFNKIRDYHAEPYSDLTATFRRQLTEIRRLVVSGYSFGDKGINEVLSGWMRADRRTRMLVLAANENECFKHARGAIVKLREDLPGRIEVRSPYLCGYKWQDLKALLAA